jgi:hypothetical protein
MTDIRGRISDQQDGLRVRQNREEMGGTPYLSAIWAHWRVTNKSAKYLLQRISPFRV